MVVTLPRHGDEKDIETDLTMYMHGGAEGEQASQDGLHNNKRM